MKKLYIIIILALIILIVLAGGMVRDLFFPEPVVLNEAEIFWMEEKPIRIGVIGQHNLFDNRGNYNGIIADHLKLIQKRLKTRFVFVDIEDEREAEYFLEAGEIDVTASLYIKPEKRASLNSSFPIFITYFFVIGSEKKQIVSLKELRSMNVGVIKGSLSEKVMRKRISSEISYRTFSKLETGLDWVSKNDSTFLLVDDFCYLGFANMPENVTISVLDLRYTITLVSKPNKPLINSILNKGFGMITKEEYREIVHRWTGFVKRDFWQYQDFGYLILTLLGVIVLFIAMILLWNFSLKKRVMLQTSVIRNEYDARIAAEREAQYKEKQLLHADRMVSLGTLVSGVAHEINNPNNYIQINARLINDIFSEVMPILDQHADENPDFSIINIPYEDMKKEITNISAGLSEGSAKISDIVNSLKEFARPDSHNWNMEVDIETAIRSAVKITANTIRNRNIELLVDIKGPFKKASGNRGRLEQVLVNLLTNASEAIESKKGVIELKGLMDRSDESVIISVRDNGKGIPKEDLPRVADPFFTTRSDKGGIGLGLSISLSIVRKFGGRMEYESTTGKGTEVKVVIPVRK